MGSLPEGHAAIAARKMGTWARCYKNETRLRSGLQV